MNLRFIGLIFLILFLVPQIVLSVSITSWSTPTETAYGNNINFYTTYVDDNSQPIITNCYINIDNQDYSLVYNSNSEVYSWSSNSLNIGTHTYISTCNSDSSSKNITIHDSNWCSDSELRACDTGLLGICGWGHQSCQSNSWSSCQQNYSSRPEDCSNNLDDNCNGLVDDEDISSCNDPPIFETINNISTTVNNPVSFTVIANDPENHEFVLSLIQSPTGANFAPSTGLFSWNPQDEHDKHSYIVTFQAEDEYGASSTISTHISVGIVNNPPVFNQLEDLTISEGEHISFSVTAKDEDQDLITILTSVLPSGIIQTGSQGGAGLQTTNYGWTPSFSQSGTYNITFTANDGIDTSQTSMNIIVTDVNQAPVLDEINQQTLNEEEYFEMGINANDFDKDNLTISASNLPTGANFNYERNGRSVFSWTPSFNQGGVYSVQFSVNDGKGGSDQISVSLIVGNANRPPILNPINHKSIGENEVLAFVISGSDPDGENVSFSASNLPPGARFDESKRFFRWVPNYEQTGQYNVIFRITDEDGASDSEEITITVGNINRAPILNPIGDKVVSEGEWLTFQLIASDPDGDPIIFDVSNLPPGATFDYATGFFSWQPEYTYAGPDQLYLTFFVKDFNNASDAETIVISIGDVNRRPRLDIIGNKQLLPGQTLFFTVSGSDPDGDNVLFDINNIPIGASFVDRTFSWTPTEIDVANHRVNFIISDGELNDSEEIVITVGDINRPPIFSPIGDRKLTVNEHLEISIHANDPEQDNLSITASNLPSGAEFIDNDDGSASLSWKPKTKDIGNHLISFNVSDLGGEKDWEWMLISVVAPSDICLDGTRLNHCSKTKPKFCENGTLIDNAETCGCPPSLIQKNNICLLKPLPRNISYVNIKVNISSNSSCQDYWRCSQWDKCINGWQIRECFDGNFCEHPENSPITNQTCGCENNIKDGNEIDVDCGGDCISCPEPTANPALNFSVLDIKPDKPFSIEVSNNGEATATGLFLEIENKIFPVQNIEPNKKVEVKVDLPPSILLNKDVLAVKLYSEKEELIDANTYQTNINIPSKTVYYEERNNHPILIIIFNNSNENKKTGIEVEVFLSRDKKIIYEDFYGPYKIESDELFVKEIELLPNYLTSGKISVQAKFFEKGVLLDNAYSESEILVKKVIPKRTLFIILAVIILIVVLYFSSSLLYKRLFPK